MASRPDPYAGGEASPGLKYARDHVGQAMPTTAMRVIPWRTPAARRTPAPDYFFQAQGQQLHLAQLQRLRLDLRPTKPGRVHAKVLDGKGHFLRELADLQDPRGTVRIEWNGMLENGKSVIPGPYLVVLEGPDRAEEVSVTVWP